MVSEGIVDGDGQSPEVSPRYSEADEFQDFHHRRLFHNGHCCRQLFLAR